MSFLWAVAVYWIRVWLRAIDDAFALAKAYPWQMLVSIVVLFISAQIWSLFEGEDEGYKKLLWGLIPFAVLLIVVLPVYLAWFLFITPYVLSKEANAAFGERVSEAEQDNRRITEEKAALIALATNLESEKTSLVHAVEKAKTSDPTINLKRRELEKLIGRFNKLIALFEKAHHASVEDFYSLDMDAKNFVAREFSSFRDYAGKYPFRDTHTTKIRYSEDDFKNLSDICRHRISTLNELLSHFT